jgi:hypothetical protein
VLCLGQEVEEDAGIELLLSQLPPLEESLPGGIEGAVEGGKEAECVGGEQRLRFGGDGAEDFNSCNR